MPPPVDHAILAAVASETERILSGPWGGAGGLTPSELAHARAEHLAPGVRGAITGVLASLLLAPVILILASGLPQRDWIIAATALVFFGSLYKVLTAEDVSKVVVPIASCGQTEVYRGPDRAFAERLAQNLRNAGQPGRALQR